MTAYTVPAEFAHGSPPNAVDLNTLSTAQVHISEILPATAHHPCAFYNTSDSVQRWVVLTHTYRYLHYATDGSAAMIMRYSPDYTDNNAWGSETWKADNGVSLGETNGNLDAIVIATYDLDSISWLNYGDQYVVFDTWGCYEYDEAHPPIEATPPFYATNFLSAAALNSLGRNIEVIKGRMDAPVRPRLIESSDRWLFKKLAGADSLVIKGTIMDDSVSSVSVKVAQNPSSMGSAIATFNNGGSGYAANDTFDTGDIDISAYTDGEDYLVEVTDVGSGYVRVEQIYTTE